MSNAPRAREDGARGARERSASFALRERQAKLEAQRCLLCEDPPCRQGCPAGIDPREFIRKIRFHDLAGAARHLRDRNILAGACGELCPGLSLCSGRCLRERLDRAIDIPDLQRFVCEWERLQGDLIVANGKAGREAVAVVGGGPAGLSCAAELARRGFAVTVFERNRELGGIPQAAIPGFRASGETLAHDLGLVRALGVVFRPDEAVPSALALREGGFGAVFVATGAAGSPPLRIAGEEAPQVLAAIAWLRAAKAGRSERLGRRVVVIGGGNTAIDAARLARRLGSDVSVLYRRRREDMPAHREEVDAALGEGIELLLRVEPIAFLRGAGMDAPLAGVRLQRVRWSEPGRGARLREPDGEPFDLPCDCALVAIGLAPDQALGLATDAQGRILRDGRSGMTSVAGIFAGGDAVSGAGLVVEAVAAGKAAAEAIEEYLATRCASAGAREAKEEDAPAAEGAARAARAPRSVRRPVYRAPRAELSVRFCGIECEHPFLLAAGPPTDDLEMVRRALAAGWAGAVLKTTSVAGTRVSLANPMMSAPREDLGRLDALGNIDLISIHPLEVIAERVRALKREFPEKLIAASMMGSRRADWVALAATLDEAGADLIECSFSCPQGTLGSAPGAMIAQDAALVRRVAGWVKSAARRAPVVIKITPQVADVGAVAAAVREAGCDGICASNSVPALTGLDATSWAPQPDLDGLSTYSGLTGPAVKPVTLRTIAEVARHGGLPVTGTGGPLTWEDAVEFMLVGATTVQFCTAVMRYGFDIVADLREGLGDYLDRRGLASARELIGRALPRIVDHERLPRAWVRARIEASLCVGDGLCATACRDGGHQAIRLGEDRRAAVDEDRCVGCGLCRLICPVPGCIILESRPAGEGTERRARRTP